jgi:hypothetical protein
MRNINVQGNAFCYAGPVGSGRGGSRKIPDGFSGASPPVSLHSAIPAMSCDDSNCHADHQPGRTKKVFLVAAIIALVLGALFLTGCPQPTNGGNTPGGGGGGETYQGHTVLKPDGSIEFAEIRKNGWDDSKAYLEAQKALDCLTDQSNAIKTAYTNWNPSTNPEINLKAGIITFQSNLSNGAYNENNNNAHTAAGLAKSALNNVYLPITTFIGEVNNENVPYFKQVNAFLLGNKIQQRSNYNQFEDGGMTYQAEFASLCSDIGIQNPQDIGAAIAAIREQLQAQLATAGPSGAPAKLVQQIADIGKLEGWCEDLDSLGLGSATQPLSQATNKSNVKIAFPEPQAQPKLSRAEIQAQHGIVNSEELLQG